MNLIKRIITKWVLAYKRRTKLAMADNARKFAAEAHEKARQYSVEACQLEAEAIFLGQKMEVCGE